MKNKLLVALLFFGYLGQAQGVPKDLADVELMSLMKDLVVTTKNGQNMKQVMLMPPEYWYVALNDSPMAGAFVDEFTAGFEGHFVVAALDLDIGAFGNFESNEMDLTFIGTDGSQNKPLNEQDLPSEMKTVLNVMKPMMGSMLGELGSNYEFLVFSSVNANNETIIDLYGADSVSFIISDTTLDINFPLNALVVEKICPTDNKTLSGSWKYCPWHGTTLKAQN